MDTEEQKRLMDILKTSYLAMVSLVEEVVGGHAADWGSVNAAMYEIERLFAQAGRATELREDR